MSKNLDAIKTKIRALLSRSEANGATEAEAATAMRKAQKLMLEHSFTLEDIKNGAVSPDDFASIEVDIVRQMGTFNLSVAQSIAKFTDTRFISTSGWSEEDLDAFYAGKQKRINLTRKFRYYGYQVDIELANYLYKVCKTALQTEWARFRDTLPRGTRRKASKAFEVMFCERLCERIDAMKEELVDQIPTGTDLIVLKQTLVEQFLQSEFGGKLNQKSRDLTYNPNREAEEAGRAAAERVRLNKAVGDGPKVIHAIGKA